ncbi:hypothetical protein E2562_007288 [Oryza meyeriana var. granulata]|uniref:BZIP domain-containing protein n=1 Tax=Oryza meyeriana var. granulata TaxID=110450 RepID=A0A6G1CE53_9ORYZ|nr:hypothetical protein E2562_007288 [Oryza meyeriana var. granulata]
MLVSSGNANQEQIESTDNEANSMGGGDMPRHCRSLSMESFTTRNLDLGAVGQTMPNFQLPSTGEGVGGHGGSGSNGDHTALIDAKLGNGEFSEAEKKTIMESESLSELVLTDPKKVKKILSNRRSAKRSKERKLKHKVALERKLQLLQMEITKLSQQLMMVQREFSGLLSQNNELKIRIQEMDRQRQMSDAIFEAMAAEAMQLVQVAFGDQFNYPHVPNGSQQQMSTQMIQLQQPQTQAQPSQTQQNQP